MKLITLAILWSLVVFAVMTSEVVISINMWTIFSEDNPFAYLLGTVYVLSRTLFYGYIPFMIFVGIHTRHKKLITIPGEEYSIGKMFVAGIIGLLISMIVVFAPILLFGHGEDGMAILMGVPLALAIGIPLSFIVAMVYAMIHRKQKVDDRG